jgi:glutathione peroxidase-family protein
MKQLVKLQDLYKEFVARGVEIVAFSNEEKSFMAHTKVIGQLGESPPYPILCDAKRKATPRYERTTAYLVGRDGTVQQVFPMEVYDRPPWWAILNEIDRLDATGERRASLR